MGIASSSKLERSSLEFSGIAFRVFLDREADRWCRETFWTGVAPRWSLERGYMVEKKQCYHLSPRGYRSWVVFGTAFERENKRKLKDPRLCPLGLGNLKNKSMLQETSPPKVKAISMSSVKRASFNRKRLQKFFHCASTTKVLYHCIKCWSHSLFVL